jgi:hypothetical protein
MQHTDSDGTRRRKKLTPSAKTKKLMQPFSFSDFDKLVERASKTPSRKPCPKSR